MQYFTKHARFLIAFCALAIAFALSVQFSDRGVQFDLSHANVSASEGGEKHELSALRILSRVLLQLQDNYVEPERIHPEKMLIGALDAVQQTIPQVVFTYHTNAEDSLEKLDVLVEGQTKSYDFKGFESLWAINFQLKEIFNFIEQHLTLEPDIKLDEVEYAAVNGMLNTLDPHSTLLPPRHYEEMQTQTGGRFGGLGIVISISDGALTVVSPIDGTPAAQKGIKARDTIVRIGEESTINMNLNEAVNMLRGEPGTDVDIWVMRANWSEPRQFTVTRAIIKIDSIDSHALANKVGYIRIKNFQANTTSDLRTHLDQLRDTMGGMQGLVLDLRDNPGGLLDQSIRVSDLFLNDGAIVSTVGIGNKLRETKQANKVGTEPQYPIVVLVNAGSASASEIVAGAIQNNNRGIVIGDTTFGKGTVQVLYELPDRSALKLTVAQYLTPGDISIQSRGIIPDLYVMPVRIKEGTVNMFTSGNSLREEDLNSHLTNSSEVTAREGIHYIRYLNNDIYDEAEDDDPDTIVDTNTFKEDFEIRLAQQLVVASGDTWDRNALLTTLQPELQKVYEREYNTIQKEFQKLNVDWRESTNGDAPNPSVKLSVSTDKQNNTVQAGDTISITATLTNTGDQPVSRLKALTTSDNPVLQDREFIFGRVNPGETKQWTIDIEIPKELSDRHDRVVFTLSDAAKNLGEPQNLDIQIEGQARPHFAFAYEVVDQNGDGLMQKDEDITFRMHVQNIGTADSTETHIYLKNLSREAIYLHKGREEYESIAKGEHVTAEFNFSVRNVTDDDFLELELDIYDMRFREFLQKKIKLPIHAQPETIEATSGTVAIKSSATNIYTGASTKADVVAMADKDARFPVIARIGQNWYKVQLNNLTGWVRGSTISFDAQAKNDAVASVAREILFQKPQIQLDPSQMITSNSSVSLKGIIQDEATIKDYYIYVYNREDQTRVNTRKINYVPVKATTADILTDIPLFEGMNQISVIARNQAGMTTSHSVYVYRN